MLNQTIGTIRDQLIPGDEIVCVDDGPYDGIDGILDQALTQQHSPISWQYVRTGNENYRNSSKAKNIGLKMAKNELIVIHEAEILGQGQYIKQMRDHFTARERKFVSASNFTALSENGSVQVHMLENQAPYFAGVLRKDLLDITGWDERYKFWGNEDNDLMFRLGLNQVRVMNDPTIAIQHLWHDRPPADAMGDCNDSLLYDKAEKVIKVNEGKPWGILQQS